VLGTRAATAAPAAVPARLEDVVDTLSARLAEAAEKIADEMRREQARALEALEQQASRWGRWR
jgi:uncharacterized protein with von Willebrand factor type A (vWA) domain